MPLCCHILRDGLRRRCRLNCAKVLNRPSTVVVSDRNLSDLKQQNRWSGYWSNERWLKSAPCLNQQGILRASGFGYSAESAAHLDRLLRLCRSQVVDWSGGDGAGALRSDGSDDRVNRAFLYLPRHRRTVNVFKWLGRPSLHYC